MNKKYYWLKLKNDFFTDKRIKKLRTIAGGDTYTIIYLKMQLLSLKDDGYLYFDNVEDTFEEEIALEIDENVEDVKVTINFLMRNGLLEQKEVDEYELIETRQCIGSETASTIRSRKSREKKKMLQCNTNATKCNIEIEKEKDIEIDKDNNICDDTITIKNVFKENKICECITKSNNEKCTRKASYLINGKYYCNQHSRGIIPNGEMIFKKPSIEEIKAYCEERHNDVNPNKFYDFYESKNWYVGKNKMKDWKASVRTWEKNANNNSYLPNWFNEEQIVKPLSKQEQEEMDALLEDF